MIDLIKLSVTATAYTGMSGEEKPNLFYSLFPYIMLLFCLCLVCLPEGDESESEEEPPHRQE